MKEWKIYQQLYNSLITEHSDASDLQPTVISDELVENALSYVMRKDEAAIYPAKSYIVAIIYATKLSEVYGEDFYEVLNDPDLFCGQDLYFKTYDEDPDTYDQIIERLKSIDGWLSGGWAPFTVNYFYLECTEEGVNRANDGSCATPNF